MQLFVRIPSMTTDYVPQTRMSMSDQQGNHTQTALLFFSLLQALLPVLVRKYQKHDLVESKPVLKNAEHRGWPTFGSMMRMKNAL